MFTRTKEKKIALLLERRLWSRSGGMRPSWAQVPLTCTAFEAKPSLTSCERAGGAALLEVLLWQGDLNTRICLLNCTCFGRLNQADADRDPGARYKGAWCFRMSPVIGNSNSVAPKRVPGRTSQCSCSSYLSRAEQQF